MPTTEMKPDTIQAAATIGAADQPIFMVNLLRYNEQATYGADANLPPCSGREAYFQRYVPAFGELAEGTGVRPVWVGHGFAGIVAPAEERWDDIAIVEYPSFAVFRALVESDVYRIKADPHRAAALADWRLIATTKTDLP